MLLDLPLEEIATGSLVGFIGAVSAIALVSFLRHVISELRGDNPDLPF